MGRRAEAESGLREAPLLPGLAPAPSEEGATQAEGRRGAAPGIAASGVEGGGRGRDAAGAPSPDGDGSDEGSEDGGTAPGRPKDEAGGRGAGGGRTERPADPPDHLDHRKRLRARFLEGGADAMPDYELLELVLFRAIPRRDVKPLAKRLLRAFGGFAETVCAPPARLGEVQGVGDAVVQELKIIEAAAQRFARASVMHRDAVQTWDQLVDYCRARLARAEAEEFRVLYLDRRNMLIADEQQGQGTVDHVPVYPREVIKRGLELSASALILVHNHPSGDPSPSRADVEMTRKIVEAGRTVGLSVHDHIIVGRHAVASFHDLGLMDE